MKKQKQAGLFLDGREILDLSPEERPISTVFQSYGLFPHKSVMDNIIYGFKFKGLAKKEALREGYEILKLLGLKGYENRKIHQLSGGEQQRVALGRSLIIRSDLLLLDQPFSNLDAKLRLVMREEVQRIQKLFNITTIFVTHDQEDAFSVADQIILMNKGKIEQISSPMEIYSKPKGEFALDFIGRSNIKRNGRISFVRPEDIKIYSKPREATVQGVIEKSIFKGTIVEYHILIESQKLIAIELSSRESYKRGDKVYLDFKYKTIGETKN